MHPTLRHRASQRHGVFTSAEALAAGYSHGEVRHLCTSGRWVRLRRGVFITADDLSRVEGRVAARHAVDCLAVLLTLGRPATVASHSSAARLWGWPLARDLSPLVRLTDPDQWRRRDDHAIACAPLPATHVGTRGPVPVTAAARTLVDCAREWHLVDAVVALDAALLRGHTSPDELAQALASARGWRGAARAARAVALADGRAESPLETRGRLRVIGAGLASFEPQVEIWAGGRLVAVVDGWYDDAAVAVEFDGREKYTDPWRDRSPGQVLWEEKRREDALRGLEVRVLRIADADVTRGWPPVEQRLRDLLSRPGPTVRRFTVVRRQAGVLRTR
ncbi:type IV toxin-antitoxin system AbiEi family antitoxin domain-containing protein [uncultured Modestobacter sp.]|uniref:type IV toxin-antitoxin system AbiEi family antitoxin domain-containing protein n=1 Tax=uncultured Modestobacter sp. TaxID=380048 RepID=UPI002623F881|nr:type IV toxin-antitoxin system AbiEi family antitoxin domain-containing protein [uncultured Modestobacter sp.]